MTGQEKIDYIDVVIIGAGLSGIGAAHHLQEHCPGKRYVILEGRVAMGGTWDLFRFPGIRSDSDMHTLGYEFKPWLAAKAIADGASILQYIRETATEGGIEQHIRYQHLVRKADWSEADANWTIEIERTDTGQNTRIRCGFILMCGGYYSYEAGYTPEFKGRERFRGDIVHPQEWPEELDYKNKKVVVIGSGATAVTLIPEIARDAAHVVMLQRSPTYMVSMPDTDTVNSLLRKFLPEKLAYAITRWKNIRFQHMVYNRSRANPEMVKRKLLEQVRTEMGPDYDIETHFTPRYDPWVQRLCLVPNSDFFKSVRSGDASIVTDRIDTFTEKGILLESGEELEADIIVTATGLNLMALGGAEFSVDGQAVDISKTVSYLGMMFSDLPNLISTFGYINASWTLRADLTAHFACRVINHMDRSDYRQCTPRLREEDKDMAVQDWLTDFSSGYIKRGVHLLPRQGDKAPWLNTQNYMADRKSLPKREIDDGILRFTNPASEMKEANANGLRSDAA